MVSGHSCISFPWLYHICIEVLTTRPLWVCTPVWHWSISCFMLSIDVLFKFITELWMENGWNECMWWNKVGDCELSWIWSFIFDSSLIVYWIVVVESCKAFMPSLGRGRISVKPTGHARFSVEFNRLIWNKKSIFLKENQLDQMGFILFIHFLVVKPFITNSQRFLNQTFPNLN